MYKATASIVLPTTIIGSLPRPSWYTMNLGNQSFLEAMMNSRFREQYTDALSAYLRDQETAGLDICTDGDCRFDEEVGGQSWTSYPPKHMSGFDNYAIPLPGSGGGTAFPRGHILHDYVEAKIFPSIVGPVGRGKLQYVGIGRGTRKPSEALVKEIEKRFRDMEAGVGNELTSLIAFLNGRYAADKFNQVQFSEVQRIAATCPTGCAIADPGKVSKPAAFEGFSSKLVSCAVNG